MKPRSNMFLTVLAVLVVLYVGEYAGANLTRREILADLLNASIYDSSISPDIERETPTVIKIQILIHNIYSVSSADMDYSIDVMFRQQWEDQRLNYTAKSEHERLELDNHMIGRVWIPDTYFPNEKSASVHQVTLPNKMLHVYRNGTVVYSIRLSLKLVCYMKLHKYPLDEQHCPIIIESYAYTVDYILYEWHPVLPVKLSENIEIPQFDANMEVSYQNCENSYNDISTNKFACLETKIQLTRKVGYYVMQVFGPSILVVILSWVSFWIDLEAVPARISLGLLTILTITTQISGTKDALSHVSYVKAIDVWMAACMLFVFASLVEFAYASVICRSKRFVTWGAVGNECQETGDVELDNKSNPIEEEPETKWKLADKPPLSPGHRLDKLSRLAFPLAFAVFNLAFWLYYLL